jgi:hypothetical protein
MTDYLSPFSVTGTKYLCFKLQTISQFVDCLVTMNEMKRVIDTI